MRSFPTFLVFLLVSVTVFAGELPKPFYCIIYYTDKGVQSQSTTPLEHKIVVVQPWRKDNKGEVNYRLRTAEARKYAFVTSDRFDTKTIVAKGLTQGWDHIYYFDTYNEAFEFCVKNHLKLVSSQQKKEEAKIADISPDGKNNTEKDLGKVVLDSPLGPVEVQGLPKGVRNNVAQPTDPKMYYTVKKLTDGNLLVTIHSTPLGDVKTTVEIGAPGDFISTGSVGFRVNEEIKNPYVEIEYVDGKVTSVKWDARTVSAEKNNSH